MFVYTMKASSIKFFAVIAVSVAVLVSVITLLPSVSASFDAAEVATDYRGTETTADMREFLSGFDYEVEEEPVKQISITVPEEFNSVYEKYNDIQRAQGLNLKRYAGKSADVYVFRVTNYGTEGNVYATLIIRNGRIIGGDICSPDGDGFVHGFKKP